LFLAIGIVALAVMPAISRELLIRHVHVNQICVAVN